MLLFDTVPAERARFNSGGKYASAGVTGELGEGQLLLGRRGRMEHADASGAAGHALDGAGRLQGLQVVLRCTDAAEAEGAGDLGLRGRHAVGVDALGDQGEDGVLGIGQVHVSSNTTNACDASTRAANRLRLQ